MIDPFAKAEQWRGRAAALRTSANRMREREVRASLLAIADGLEHHARALENMSVRLHCTGRVFCRQATEVVEAAD